MASRKYRIAEIVAIATLLVIGACVLVPMVESNRREGQHRKDEAQVAGVMTALVVSASNGSASYPLPSTIDVQNETTSEAGEAKNTTANIFSIMVSWGSLTPEQLVSPSEPDPIRVRVMRNYCFGMGRGDPPTSVVPGNSLWDPAFRGTPIEPVRLARGGTDSSATAPGNFSYAHVPPFGKRRSMWSDTYNSTEPAFTNRGPTYASDDAGPVPKDGKWSLVSGPNGTASKTLGVYDEKGSWAGFVGFNDIHVTMERSPTPSGVVYRNRGAWSPVEKPDNIFVDEADETTDASTGVMHESHINSYLRPYASVSPAGGNSVFLKTWRD